MAVEVNVMACSRKVREAARRYWLLGYSDEKMVPMLKADFPDEPCPNRANTILAWRQQEDWASDLSIIAAKAQENRREELATELAQMSARQLALLGLLDSHAQLLLTARVVKSESGKMIDTQLGAGEIAQVASALERSIKNQRLIRGVPTSLDVHGEEMEVDFSKLTDAQLERIRDGEPPRVVLKKRGAK